MELVWKNTELYFQWSCLKLFYDNLQIGKEMAI
jgi:hypothetical protein